MKNVIFGLLCVFLIGTFVSVSHGATNESKKTEIVKLADCSGLINYAVVADEVIINIPAVADNVNYKIAETAKLSLADMLFYHTLRSNKNSWGNSWVSCDSNYKNLNSNKPNTSKPKKKRFNFNFYNKPKLC